MSMRKRWDVAKRYLKHSEHLLKTPPTQLGALICRYLKAFKEVLPPNEVFYLQGNQALQLHKNQLVTLNPAQPQHNWVQLTLLETAKETHRVLYNEVKLNSEKQKFIDLITAVFTAKLHDWLKSPEGLEAAPLFSDPAHPKVGILKARYRRQREVILSIERFAKRQSPELKKQISALPELEEEIINFQNQLLNDLEQAKTRLHQTEGKLKETELFVGQVFDEMANKIHISRGLLHLCQPSDKPETAEFNPLRSVDTRLHNLSDFVESFAQSMEAQTYQSPHKFETFTLLEGVHLALGEFAHMESAHNCQFQFNQTLNRYKLTGDVKQLSLGLTRLFQFVLVLQEYETQPEVLNFKLKAKPSEQGTQLRVEISGLKLSKKLALLVRPQTGAYQQAPSGYVFPQAMQQIVSRTLAQQGAVTFLVRDQGRLDVNITIQPEP